MQAPGFEEDVTVGSENTFSFGEGCDTTRIYNLENTFAREFRSIDMRLTSIDAVLPHLATKADLSRLETRMHGMQGSLQAEMGTLRGEMGTLRREVGNLRAEMQTGIGSLRTEIGTLRTEMRTEIGSLRGEMGTLRGEMSHLQANMHTAMRGLQASMMMWFLASTCTIITVIAVLITALIRMPGGT